MSAQLNVMHESAVYWTMKTKASISIPASPSTLMAIWSKSVLLDQVLLRMVAYGLAVILPPVLVSGKNYWKVKKLADSRLV